MKLGFESFCQAYSFDYEIISDFSNQSIALGDLYIIPHDRDLLLVIENAMSRNLRLGEDFGIISYNETPLKKIAANGITTISTNFELMGKILADMVLHGIKEQIENKSALIVRNSL